MVADNPGRNVFKFLIRIVHGVGLCGEFKKADVVVTVTKGILFFGALALGDVPYALGFRTFAMVHIKSGESLWLYAYT